jgi:hypothetical protein
MAAHSTLYYHARRLFGTWEDAVWDSGINYDKERVQVLWTKDGVLNWIRREWKQGKDIRPGITKKQSAGVFNAAVREFGGWYPAIRASKIKGFKEVRLRKWTPKSLIAALKDYGPNASGEAIARKDPGLASTVYATFGAWKNARVIAGYPPTVPPPPPPRWTREVLLKTIRERARTHPRLRTRVFLDLGGFAKAAAHMFGSWPNAVRAAGCVYEPVSMGRPCKWTREIILETINQRAANGKSLRQVDIRKEPGSLCDAARKEFGGWHEALRAAGLEPPPRKAVWAKEQLIATLRRQSRKGVSARKSALSGKFSGLLRAAYEHFGSLEAAIVAAGLKVPARQWKWPKERVLAEIVRLKKLGRPLPHILYTAAKHRFGGVKKALASLGTTPLDNDRSRAPQPG